MSDVVVVLALRLLVERLRRFAMRCLVCCDRWRCNMMDGVDDAFFHSQLHIQVDGDSIFITG